MAIRREKSIPVAPILVTAAMVSTLLLMVPARGTAAGTCGRGGKCPVTSLSVQFVDSGYPVTSDGLGLYYDGVDNVQASFDDGGGFDFDTGIVLPALRGMTSQYAYPLPGSPLYALSVGPGAHYSWHTADAISIAAQELAPAHSICWGGYIKSEDTVESYSTLFHSGIEGTSTSPTGKWLLTRIDANTWTLETSPMCGGDVVNLRHRIPGSQNKQGVFQYETIGYYHLPFKLILTRQ
jgi:hypothetical protein